MDPNQTEMIFPPRLIPTLRELRGPEWGMLVDEVGQIADDLAPERVAFVLMMARLNGCASCNADAYRAMRGCSHCTQQTVRRHRGSDKDLLRNYQEARLDAERYFVKK